MAEATVRDWTRLVAPHTRAAGRHAAGRWAWAGALLLAGAGGLAAWDHTLSHADRALYAHRRNEMVSVYDQVLRYEHEHLELPRRFSDLVPVFLREDQITRQGAAAYRLDATNRTLTLTSGQTVRGLLHRTWPAPVLTLPPFVPVGLHGRLEQVATHAFAPRGPEGKRPPDGALIFEAEHYTALNYGWEVHADTTCGGGAYAYSKEGIANGPGQFRSRVFDFHNIREQPERTRIRWHFRVPQTGRYYICGRIWTTGSHCSNNFILALDGADLDTKSRAGGPSLGNLTPFRWRWETVEGGAVQIEAGDHFLEAFLHEDGVWVDQFALTPERLPQDDAIYAANVVPVNRDTAFRQQPGPPVALAFDLQTMVLSASTNPVCNLTIRKLRPAEGLARIRLSLTHAGTNGKDLALGEYVLDLAGKEELLFMPVSFQGLDIAALARREYLLVADAVRQRQVIAHAHIPLWRPCRWEVAGPFDNPGNDGDGPLDGDREMPPDRMATTPWLPFRDTSFNCFGVLDFGLQTVSNSLYAPQDVMIYARTTINVPRSGPYLLKVASDDQMLLWCDGRLIYRQDSSAPVSRSAERETVTLEQGPHRIRMRVNNIRNWNYADDTWQAVLRFRTTEDDLSDVTGQ